MKTDREKSIGYMPRMSSCGSIFHITTDDLEPRSHLLGVHLCFYYSGGVVGREWGREPS